MRIEEPRSATMASAASRMLSMTSSSVAGSLPDQPWLRTGELYGQSYRPTHSHHRLPRRGTRAPRVRHPAGQNHECLRELQPGQVRAETVGGAAAEGQYRGYSFTADIEAVGVGVDGRITIGCKVIDEKWGSRGLVGAAELEALDNGARR